MLFPNIRIERDGEWSGREELGAKSYLLLMLESTQHTFFHLLLEKKLWKSCSPLDLIYFLSHKWLLVAEPLYGLCYPQRAEGEWLVACRKGQVLKPLGEQFSQSIWFIYC